MNTKRAKPTWVAVDFVFADGSTGAGVAASVGEGWCDAMAPLLGGGHTRFWVKSDGTTDPPMNMVRLAKPICDYQRAPGLETP